MVDRPLPGAAVRGQSPDEVGPVRWTRSVNASRTGLRWTWIAGAGLVAIGALGILSLNLSHAGRVVVLFVFVAVLVAEIELLARIRMAAADAARAEAERSLERARRLQDIAGALGQALTVEAVGDAILSGAISALDADRGMVAELVDAGKDLRVLSAHGYPDGFLDHWHQFPAELPGPMSEALQARRPVVVATREEVYARWPNLAGAGL